jgi:hypothetical protein
MKVKQNIVSRFDEINLEMKNELKDFFNTTDKNLSEISKATKLSNPFLSEIKGFLNNKPGAKQYSAEKIRDILFDLYKSDMIK